MPALISNHIKVFHQANRTEAVLLAHGAYEPKKAFSKGSGKVQVPAGMSLFFYAKFNDFGIGSAGRVNQALMGACAARECAPPHTWVINYALSHKERSSNFKDEDWLDDTAVRDFIVVRKDQEASLGDVFTAIQQLGLHYTTLHALHCRVTFEQARQAHAGWE